MQLFLLWSCNSVTTLLSSRDAFRQREKDYQSIFISVLQIYITTQAIRKRVQLAQAAKRLNVFTTSLLSRQDRSGMIGTDERRGRVKRKKRTAAGVRPGVLLDGIINIYSIKKETILFNHLKSWIEMVLAGIVSFIMHFFCDVSSEIILKYFTTQ